MTDFGLMGGYCVHNSLDQGEIFSLLLWCIFYDSLLCKVKCQESVCEYRLNSHFISRSSCTKSQTGLSFFFFAGAFIDNTIWINNISINNDKMVAILINSRVSNPSLSINGLPISIVKKSESHQYLGIFLSTEGFLKLSLAKANLDIRFFTNLVLKKAISDKQLLYLVLMVFHLIVSYKMQFSFVPVDVYNKWDSESKIASLVSFVNSGKVLGYLFSHRSHDLQVLCWCLVYLLSSPVYIYVSASNNFLAGMVHILFDCNLFLGGSLASSFWFHGGIFMFALLGKQWKKLDPHGPILKWFKISVMFLNDVISFLAHLLVLSGVGLLNILNSGNFIGSGSLSVYMNGFLKDLSTVGCKAGTAAFFKDINLGLGIGILGLILLTMAELQIIALALECVSLSSSVCLFLNSQSALDACKSELGLYWVKCQHIVNIIHSKNLRVSWHKIKDHSGISGNEHADMIAGTASFSVGFGSKFLTDNLLSEVNWLCLLLVPLASAHTYFIKVLYYQLLVAIWKCLYNKCYPSVLCLYCGNVKMLDHVFFCETLSGFSHSSSSMLQLLSFCVSDSSVFMALYKSFVFNNWFYKVISVFCNSKIASSEVVKFVYFLGLIFKDDVWVVCVKHCAYMEKTGLILLNSSALASIFGLVLRFSAGVIKLLGITKAFGAVKKFGLVDGFKFVLLRKKKKDSTLKDGVKVKDIPAKVFDSINIKKKCLVKKISFNYGNKATFDGVIGGNIWCWIK
ncbi:hypothetical protein G9A89_015464 [Geosiphon pyriformis]|nr:hypothetical protein G9A89_015464 [Geosiphon pyriformis]